MGEDDQPSTIPLADEPPRFAPPRYVPPRHQPAPAVAAHEACTEPAWQRRLSECIGLIIGAGFLYLMACYHVPAHGGADQNGYLVGGKMMARNGGSPKLTPRDPITGQADPYQFVGPMWVGVDVGGPSERYYPKYPPGYPILVATAYRFGDGHDQAAAAYWINPCCMTVAALATFLLVRSLAGSLAGLLGQLVFLFSPVTLGLATNPNSHAAAAALAALGIHLLLRWTQRMHLRDALLAALLLGSAAAVRSTEVLLGIPVVVAGAHQLRRSGTVRAMLPLVVFMLPVAAVAAFNLMAMGSWTGYAATRESVAFSWRYFLGDATYSGNWETALRQFNSVGLPIIFPLAIAGLLAMIGSARRRTAWILLAWALPTATVYTFYYWAPDGNWIGYLRFFFILFPAFIAAAFWLLSRLCDQRRTWVGPIAMGSVTALAVLLGWHSVRHRLEQDQVERLMIHRTAIEMHKSVPRDSVVFGPTRTLNHLQFVADYRLYSPQTFHADTLKKVAAQETEEVLTHHPARAGRVIEMLEGDASQARLAEAQRQLIERAMLNRIRVFLTAPQRSNQSEFDVAASLMPGTPPDLLRNLFEVKAITRWNDPNPAPREKELREPRFRRRLPQPPGIDPSQSRWVIIELRPKQDASTTRPIEKP